MPFSSALTWRETAQSALADLRWSAADASRSSVIRSGTRLRAPCATYSPYWDSEPCSVSVIVPSARKYASLSLMASA
ncbi:MAG: hypothetical protein OXD41_05020, partial [Thaumarchaeota archaeon]|nr:hypothetical protein [Nitrososphaerota archaeon]